MDNTKEVQRELEVAWQRLLYKLKPLFRRKPGIEAMLFLIGIQELGKIAPQFSKEEKQDLMHMATCHLLSSEGYYRLVEKDAEGWLHYEATGKPLPDNLATQENLLKKLILRYFEE
ncbi:MAG: hypothetical protein R2798_14365 [Chitinophagales bacterium]|nr:hypothetical protein [Bacteroidota bacterium]MCB9043474.1 hypothetical protein [Chitinophagales bacterium]